MTACRRDRRTWAALAAVALAVAAVLGAPAPAAAADNPNGKLKRDLSDYDRMFGLDSEVA